MLDVVSPSLPLTVKVSLEPLDHAIEKPTSASTTFSSTITVHIIENVQDSFSKQERADTWYTARDVQRWRRNGLKLEERLSFYSNEELWDRFGINSKETRRQVRWAVQCVVETLHGMPWLHPQSGDDHCESSSDDASLYSSSSSSWSEASLVMEEYAKVSQACTEVAVARGKRIQEQVYGAKAAPSRE